MESLSIGLATILQPGTGIQHVILPWLLLVLTEFVAMLLISKYITYGHSGHLTPWPWRSPGVIGESILSNILYHHLIFIYYIITRIYSVQEFTHKILHRTISGIGVKNHFGRSTTTFASKKNEEGIRKERRKEDGKGRKEGSKEGRKDGRKQGRKEMKGRKGKKKERRKGGKGIKGKEWGKGKKKRRRVAQVSAKK